MDCHFFLDFFFSFFFYLYSIRMHTKSIDSFVLVTLSKKKIFLIESERSISTSGIMK